MKVKFTYKHESHTLYNCPGEFLILSKQLPLVFNSKFPEKWILQCKDIYGTSVVIVDRDDFNDFKDDHRNNRNTMHVMSIVPPTEALTLCRYREIQDFYNNCGYPKPQRLNESEMKVQHDKDIIELPQQIPPDAALPKFQHTREMKVQQNKDIIELPQQIPPDVALDKVQHTGIHLPIIHKYTTCDECQVSPIMGVRYKCTVCPDFNYCEKCEKTKGHSHSFIKMKENNEFYEFQCELKTRPLSVKPAEWMKFDPNTDSLVQELFNVRKNAPLKFDNFGPKNNKKQYAFLREDIEQTQIDEKIAGLLEYFPEEDLSKLYSYVTQAPKDLSMLELKENYTSCHLKSLERAEIMKGAGSKFGSWFL